MDLLKKHEIARETTFETTHWNIFYQCYNSTRYKTKQSIQLTYERNAFQIFQFQRHLKNASFEVETRRYQAKKKRCVLTFCHHSKIKRHKTILLPKLGINSYI